MEGARKPPGVLLHFGSQTFVAPLALRSYEEPISSHTTWQRPPYLSDYAIDQCRTSGSRAIHSNGKSSLRCCQVGCKAPAKRTCWSWTGCLKKSDIADNLAKTFVRFALNTLQAQSGLHQWLVDSTNGRGANPGGFGTICLSASPACHSPNLEPQIW